MEKDGMKCIEMEGKGYLAVRSDGFIHLSGYRGVRQV